MESRSWAPADLARSTVLRLGEYGVNVIVTLLMTPFLLRELGAPSYGVWLLLLSQVSLLGVLELGMGNALLRTISASRDGRTIEEARSIAANALLVTITVSAMICSVAIVAGTRLSEVVGLPPQEREWANVLLACALVLFSCSLLSGIANAVLIGKKHFAFSSTITLLRTIVNALLTWIVVLLGYGLPAVASAAALTWSAATVARFVGARVRVRDIPLSLRYVSWTRPSWRALYGFGAWSTVIQLLGTISYDLDALIVGSIVSLSAVAAFGVALKLPTVLEQLMSVAFWAFFPYAADLHGRSEIRRLQHSVQSGTKLALTLGLLALLFFWDVGPWLLEAWVGPVEDGAVLLRLGLVINALYNGFLAVEMMLYGVEEMRRLALINIVGAFVNVPLSLTLAAAVGVSGPLYATVIAGLIMVYLMIRRAATVLEISAQGFVREVVLVPVVCIIPPVVVLAAPRLLDGRRLEVLLAAAVGAVATYIALVVSVGLNQDERTMARDGVRRLSRDVARLW